MDSSFEYNEPEYRFVVTDLLTGRAGLVSLQENSIREAAIEYARTEFLDSGIGDDLGIDDKVRFGVFCVHESEVCSGHRLEVTFGLSAEVV